MARVEQMGIEGAGMYDVSLLTYLEQTTLILELASVGNYPEAVLMKYTNKIKKVI